MASLDPPFDLVRLRWSDKSTQDIALVYFDNPLGQDNRKSLDGGDTDDLEPIALHMGNGRRSWRGDYVPLDQPPGTFAFFPYDVAQHSIATPVVSPSGTKIKDILNYEFTRRMARRFPDIVQGMLLSRVTGRGKVLQITKVPVRLLAFVSFFFAIMIIMDLTLLVRCYWYQDAGEESHRPGVTSDLVFSAFHGLN
ncbi:hypothetical protein HD806DRAFT_541734 [Xylariaceae sp. AK1471]|nr:hypothetical protein HD806DRAFT_541734 [Xylariaceae sp. AK1471]